MADFVIRRWSLRPYPGDQAPTHVHLAGDEAFCVLRGRLEVLVGDSRRLLEEGEFVTVPAGTVHTFATVGDAVAEILCVMTPEIDELVAELHRVSTDEERAAVWASHHSHLAPPPAST